ncbi:hypothetical protein [Herbaspirillum sp.]|uniref:hypothetical protein n=1 Tax=Herbaspirillum sp. TaxID=1890675 RepID=UPI0025881657|nr:hypothetical protein [Herbaspirillum sp.]MCP3949451.1 hypothetical protein [Herbaspirillum sp.]
MSSYLGHFRKVADGPDVTWLRDDASGTHAGHECNGSIEMVPYPTPTPAGDTDAHHETAAAH